MENKVLAVISGTEITEKDLNSIIMRYPEVQFWNGEKTIIRTNDFFRINE